MTASTIELIEFCSTLCFVVLLPIIPAYVLYKTLPAQASVTGPFKGLNIQLKGAFAGYFLVLLILVGLTSFRTQPHRYEVWTISGKVVLKGNPNTNIIHNDVSVQPPMMLLYPDGRFDIDVPVKLGQSDKLEFPTIVISHKGYLPQTISLGDKQPLFGSKQYEVESNKNEKKRTIKTLIELEPDSGGTNHEN